MTFCYFYFLAAGMEDAIGRMVHPASARMSFRLHSFMIGSGMTSVCRNVVNGWIIYLLSPSLMEKCKSAAVHNGRENEGISDHYPVSVI